MRELLPAYVLGTLDTDELDVVEAHLQAGREHDDELVELRATVPALDRFADEQVLSGAPAVDALKSSNPPTEVLWTKSVSRLGASPVWQMVAAAVVLLAIFAAGWLFGQFTGDSKGREVSYLLQGANGEVVALSGVTSEESVVVTMSGFERLSVDRVYQFWAIREGRWLPIGSCNTNPEGRWKGDFAFQIRSGEEIALTIEPAGESQKPTSEPILRSIS